MKDRGAMDPIRGIQGILAIIQVPINLAKEDKKLSDKLENGLKSLKSELEMIKEDLKSYEELQLQELTYDIEDFVQGLWIPETTRFVLSAIALDPREGYVERIEFFQKRIERLEKRQKKSTESRSGQSGGYSAHMSELVGISEPKKMILDLLKKPASDEQDGGGQDARQPLKVISIVGCPGVGKTALARAVYDHARASLDFECVAWVAASGCNDKRALQGNIREKVQADLASRASAPQKLFNLFGQVYNKAVQSNGDDGTASALRGILADKRYLVIIDNVQQAMLWQQIVDDFPQNEKSSRIIVTTSNITVARARSSGSYVYTMQCLTDEDSKDLFWKRVYDGCDLEPSPAVKSGSKSIISKCGGLPLALITVAEHLSTIRNNLKEEECEEIGRQFGRRYLLGEEAGAGEDFRELRRALMQSYDSLPDYDQKTCMLYLSLYPRDQDIKSKSLVRRLKAEGLVDGRKSLDYLIGRCCFKPGETSSSSNIVKRCQVHTIMHEFVIQKAVSTNFVALLQEDEPLRKIESSIATVRRLTILPGHELKCHEALDKSSIRSLTMSKSNLFDFQSCKMLRILNLEGCKGVDTRFLEAICQFVYLKYLSLRSSDMEIIPKDILKLQCLETLDIRETQEMPLLIEVIMLPKLAYLLGTFELPDTDPSKKVMESLQKGKLETLGEVIVKEKVQILEEIILHARNLKKVKIACKATPAADEQRKKKSKVQNQMKQTILDRLVSSIQNRKNPPLTFVSINSTPLTTNILGSTRKTKYIKLSGSLAKLPEVATLSQLGNLSNLQLFYTGLSSEELYKLQIMPVLQYLKVQENNRDSWTGSFVVHKEGFPSLLRLCFQGSKLPKLHFEDGSMKQLTSLNLLCREFSQVLADHEDSSQLQVDKKIVKGISHIARLSEVMLPYHADSTIVKAWEAVAEGIASRPHVKKQPKPFQNSNVTPLEEAYSTLCI